MPHAIQIARGTLALTGENRPLKHTNYNFYHKTVQKKTLILIVNYKKHQIINPIDYYLIIIL
jgi:hypothetical protein